LNGPNAEASTAPTLIRHWEQHFEHFIVSGHFSKTQKILKRLTIATLSRHNSAMITDRRKFTTAVQYRPLERPRARRPASPPAALQRTTDDRRQRAKQYWSMRQAGNKPLRDA